MFTFRSTALTPDPIPCHPGIYHTPPSSFIHVAVYGRYSENVAAVRRVERSKVGWQQCQGQLAQAERSKMRSGLPDRPDRILL
ncbi:hypothetical protein LSH36_58g03043 [Paralvinella palmiformis]|uniref:Uncharacterized protein n=1 Tax=Paralvinella palmiformis TaxID=53620 RepID=A0AAD9NCD8_9ANNE|nr:hypothetical protein LSH36_58g03043 [Paralvinella palmiformis]